MSKRRAISRAVIGLLLVFLGVLLALALVPGLLRTLVMAVVGEAEIPAFGEPPPPPVINAPEGRPPGGFVAGTMTGGGKEFACGFLMQLEDGRLAGFGAAHSTWYSSGEPAVLVSPAGDILAELSGQAGAGRPFYRERFTMDYVIWRVANAGDGPFLRPDPRGQGQAGERVRVYGRFDDSAGASISWPGVVMQVDRESAWVQLEDSFDPKGFSGCPVVSEHTGRVVGMAVAGANRPPVVMGLHPVWSLVEKAVIALDSSANGGAGRAKR